jgi:hypothetical protein
MAFFYPGIAKNNAKELQLITKIINNKKKRK